MTPPNKSGKYLLAIPRTRDRSNVARPKTGPMLSVLRTELKNEFTAEHPGEPNPWTHEALCSRGAPPRTSQSKHEGGRPLGDAVIVKYAVAYGVAFEVMKEFLAGIITIADMKLLANTEQAKRSANSSPPAGIKKNAI